MPDLKQILQVVGAITALVGALFAVRGFYRWLRPIRVERSVSLVFDGSAPDQICATVTNRSAEAQYIVRCDARSTYPLSAIALRHLRRPTLSPKLYNNVRFNSPSFQLLRTGETAKLDPNQRIELHHRLSSHPLASFLTPMLLVEVELSTGRVFRSRRIPVPERWRFKPKASAA